MKRNENSIEMFVGAEYVRGTIGNFDECLVRRASEKINCKTSRRCEAPLTIRPVQII